MQARYHPPHPPNGRRRPRPMLRYRGSVGRAERKRVSDLVGTLVWSVPEMRPRAGVLPPNPDGLAESAEFDVLPGIRAVLFPDGEEWRALLLQFDAEGRVIRTMEHEQRAPDDDEAPRWAMQVLRDVLATVVAGSAPSELPRERLDRVEALIDRV